MFDIREVQSKSVGNDQLTMTLNRSNGMITVSSLLQSFEKQVFDSFWTANKFFRTKSKELRNAIS